jgi:hypothetical protein
MSNLVPDEVKKLWKESAEAFNEELSVPCLFIFDSSFGPANISEDNVGNKPQTTLTFGGKSNVHNSSYDISNNAEELIKKGEVSKAFLARVYSNPKDIDRYDIHVSEGKTAYELVTDKRYIPDILRCREIRIYTNVQEDQIRAKLIRTPAMYGLGEAVNCITFWESI